MSREEYTGFVYEWINLTNNKKYIGSHLGRTDDGYIGSGKHFIRAYTKSPDLFTRTILEYINGDRELIKSREQYYLDQIPNITKNKSYYNISPNAQGGPNHAHLSPNRRKQIYENWRAASINKLANMSDEERLALKTGKQQAWANNHETRNRHAEQTRQRRLLEESLKTDQDKDQFKELMSKTYWERPTQAIAQHHKRQSEGVKQWHDNKDPEIEAQRINKMRETKRSQCLKYVWNPDSGIRKQIPEKDLDTYLTQGWLKGMGPKIKKS